MNNITVKNEIDQIEQIYKGHGIPKETLARWLSDVDGYICREILLVNDPLTEYSYENKPDTELLVTEAPWRRMYFLYLAAMIDFVNKQYNTYANELGEYNKVISDYRHYIVTRYNPLHSGTTIPSVCPMLRILRTMPQCHAMHDWSVLDSHLIQLPHNNHDR